MCSELQMSTDAHDCSGHLAMTVRAVTVSSDPDVASTVDLLDVNAGRRWTYFDSDQDVLRTLHPGDRVTAATAGDGFTVTDLSRDGRTAHTVDSPAYRPATLLTGLAAVVFGAVLLLAALIYRVQRGRLPRAALGSTD